MEKIIENGKAYRTKNGSLFSIMNRDNFAVIGLHYLNYHHDNREYCQETIDYILSDHKAEFFGVDLASGKSFNWMPYHVSGKVVERDGLVRHGLNKYDIWLE